MMSGWLVSMGPAVANHMWQFYGVWGGGRGAGAGVAQEPCAGAVLDMDGGVGEVYGAVCAADLAGRNAARPQHTVVTMPVYSAVDEVSLPFVDAMPVAEPTHDAIRPRHERGTQLTWLVVVWLAGFVAGAGGVVYAVAAGGRHAAASGAGKRRSRGGAAPACAADDGPGHTGQGHMRPAGVVA